VGLTGAMSGTTPLSPLPVLPPSLTTSDRSQGLPEFRQLRCQTGSRHSGPTTMDRAGISYMAVRTRRYGYRVELAHALQSIMYLM